MNLLPGLTLPNPFPALPGRAVLTPEELDRLFAELASSKQTIALRDAALHAAELKIQALTLELAHHRRIRFGQKSESLAAKGERPVRRDRGCRPCRHRGGTGAARQEAPKAPAQAARPGRHRRRHGGNRPAGVGAHR